MASHQRRKHIETERPLLFAGALTFSRLHLQNSGDPVRPKVKPRPFTGAGFQGVGGLFSGHGRIVWRPVFIIIFESVVAFLNDPFFFIGVCHYQFLSRCRSTHATYCVRPSLSGSRSRVLHHSRNALTLILTFLIL